MRFEKKLVLWPLCVAILLEVFISNFKVIVAMRNETGGIVLSVVVVEENVFVDFRIDLMNLNYKTLDKDGCVLQIF